jgi:hypothetical protein
MTSETTCSVTHSAIRGAVGGTFLPIETAKKFRGKIFLPAVIFFNSSMSLDMKFPFYPYILFVIILFVIKLFWQ